MKLAGQCVHGLPYDHECPHCAEEQVERDAQAHELAPAMVAPAPPKYDPRDWWRSPTGRAATQRFEAWGRVLKERIDTGDPSAVPTMDGQAGSGRNPSSISTILLYFVEVDEFLLKYATARMRRLMAFIYVDAIEFRETGAVYVFGDGTRVALDPHEAPPAAFESKLSEGVNVRVYDLFKFEAPEVDTLCEMWPDVSKEQFLEREHLRVAKRFAAAKGL